MSNSVEPDEPRALEEIAHVLGVLPRRERVLTSDDDERRHCQVREGLVVRGPFGPPAKCRGGSFGIGAQPSPGHGKTLHVLDIDMAGVRVDDRPGGTTAP